VGIIDQFLSGNVVKQQNIHHVLASKGMAHKAVIEKLVFDVFDIDSSELWKKVLTGKDAPKGQNYCIPEILELDEEWKRTRDPDWLYEHESYWLETLFCAYLYTCKTVVDPAIAFLKGENPKLEHILDWGAGSGLSSLQLAANFPDANVYYYEISPTSIEMFEWLKNYFDLPNLHHVTELPDVEFDAIFYVEVINHIQEPMPAIDPAIRQLRVGGLLAHQTSWQFEQKYGESVGHFLEYTIDDYWTDNMRRAGRVFDRALVNRGLVRLKTSSMARCPIWYLRTGEHPEKIPSLKASFAPAKKLQFAGKTCSICRTPGHNRNQCPDAKLYPEGHVSRPWEIQSPPIWEGNPEETYVRSYGKVWTKEEIEAYVPADGSARYFAPTTCKVVQGQNNIECSSIEIKNMLKRLDVSKIDDHFQGTLIMTSQGFTVTIEGHTDIVDEEE